MASTMKVNTASLDQYTTRIRNLLKRIDNLYPRIQRLYWTGEVKGVWNLYYRNRFYRGRETVAKCRTYINQTIAEIERAEEYLTLVDPLQFQMPSGRLIDTLNFADRDGWKQSVAVKGSVSVGNEWVNKLLKGSSVLTAIAGLFGNGWNCLDNEKKFLLVQIINEIGSAADTVQELKSQLLSATGARCIGDAAADKIDINKVVGDLLKDAANALKVGGKFKDNDDASLFSSIFSFSSKIYEYITKKGGTAVDTFLDSVSLSRSAAVTVGAISKYLDKTNGKELFKYLPGLQFIGMFTSGMGFSIDTVKLVKIYREYKAGESTEAEFGAKMIDAISSGIGFGGGIVMFWNTWAPGQVEILTNGVITNGLVVNTKYLKTAGAYVHIATSTMKGVSIGVERYGEYGEDGTVDLNDWTAIVAEGGMQALNQLFLGLLPEEKVRSATDSALGFVDNWGHTAADYIDSHPEWAYWRDKNKVTNIITRAAGCGKVAGDAISDKLQEWGDGIASFAKLLAAR